MGPRRDGSRPYIGAQPAVLIERAGGLSARLPPREVNAAVDYSSARSRTSTISGR